MYTQFYAFSIKPKELYIELTWEMGNLPVWANTPGNTSEKH